MRIHLLIWAVVTTLFLGSTLQAQETATPVKIDFNIPYAKVANQTLKFDMAKPVGKGPFPVVVCLHGGAWKYGGRNELSIGSSWYNFGVPDKSLLTILAEHGYAAVSVSYRLAPKDKFPAQIQDVQTAIRFLKTNAKKYNLDPERFAVAGFSAGGHLAALVGTASETPEFNSKLYPDVSNKVKCVIDFFGPADLRLYSATPMIELMYMVPLLGARFAQQAELYKQASPIEHVSEDDPPFLIVHGTADILVPIIHSERFYKALVKAGVESKLVKVKGAGHGWGGPAALTTIHTTLKFLDEHLKS